MLSALNCTTYFITVVRRLNESVVGLPVSISDVIAQAEAAMHMELPDLQAIKAQVALATEALDQIPDFSAYKSQLSQYTTQLEAIPNVTEYIESLRTVNSSIAVGVRMQG